MMVKCRTNWPMKCLLLCKLVLRLLLREGPARRLVWGADANGTFRAKEYFDALDIATQAKFEPWFTRMAETGKIRNPEKFRHEGGNLYAYKIGAHRLPCFFDGRDVVLIDGFAKKDMRSKRSVRALENAARLRDEHLATSTREKP
jgi:mRNA-degrading endonuclease RelE of RelBE toxin-antitoxin system